MNAQQMRRGVALIDVILAVTLLAIAGTGFVALLSQNFFTINQLRERERELAAASQQLERMSALWTTTDFDAQLGASRRNGVVVAIKRRDASLYDVQIADSSGVRTLLTTTMYAAEPADATR